MTSTEDQPGAASPAATPARPRRHRTRVIGGQGGQRGWWQAWCTEADCTWKGQTHPQRVGSRQQAAADAAGHEESTGGYVD